MTAVVSLGLIASLAHAENLKTDKFTGDWGGTRTALQERGIDFTIESIGETLRIMSGGVQRGHTYEVRFEFSVDTNLDKLIG